MKTTNNQSTIVAAISVAVALATTIAAASYLPLFAIGVSYVAVGILLALAGRDYRSSIKSYATR